jgi:predicted Zn finger-like uncharacterized protein
MSEITSCPQCQRKLRVPDELLGQPVKCPSCENVFTASAEAPAAPPPVPPTTAREEHEPDAEAVRPRRRPPREEDYDDEGRDDDYDRPRRRRRSSYAQPHRGAVVLTLGILSLVICGLLGPVAWIMGSNDLAAMRAGRMDPEGEGLTRGGMICGIIASILLIVGCVIWGIIIAAGAAGGLR